jgi:hypothetical protein
MFMQHGRIIIHQEEGYVKYFRAVILGVPGEELEAPFHPTALAFAMANDEDGIVAGEGSQDLGPIRLIDRSRHSLSVSGRSLHHEQIAASRYALDEGGDRGEKRTLAGARAPGYVSVTTATVRSLRYAERLQLA